MPAPRLLPLSVLDSIIAILELLSKLVHPQSLPHQLLFVLEDAADLAVEILLPIWHLAQNIFDLGGVLGGVRADEFGIARDCCRRL
jgi:hypothetical protein